MFFAQAEAKSARAFLWAKAGGRYRPLSWSEAADQVRRLARALVALGIAPGDRVLLVAESRPEWVIADLAIMTAGAVTVPAYATNTVEDHRHLLANSGARAVIVSSAALARRVIPAANQLPMVAHIIAIEPPGTPTRAALHAWDDLLAGRIPAAEGGTTADEGDRLAALAPDDVACILYTSGTGGTPRGVMTTHRNILANCRSAERLLGTLGLGEEVFLSFLPLSHSYEHTAGVMFPIALGAEIYFAERPETLAANLLEARPTIMTAVPRLYETLHQRIRLGVARKGGLSLRMFERTLALGTKRQAGQALGLRERAADRVLDRLVRAKMRARFGGRLKAMVSGGAPLNPEIGRFFVALGIRLLQGYGQTEAAPVICCNPPRSIRIDTVGPALDGVRVRIAEDGEILVAGDNVMKGYWNDPEATSRTLDGEWLRTGDVGELDADGYLRITDRKRDFIKNSGGEMIAPAPIEGALTLEPEIAQAMVSGDRRPYLVALIVADAELARGHDPDALTKAVGAAVARVNARLKPAERVRRFLVAPAPFTTANGQMTPTLKIRRHAIRATYGADLDTLYDGKGIAA
jgi:long-chain acyl-CoA synthetase